MPTIPETESLLTERQREVNALLSGPQRHTKLVGGARSGKTVLFIRAMIMRALKAKQTRHVALRLKAIHAHEAIWLDTLPWVERKFFSGVRFTPCEGCYHRLSNGSEIWVGGLDDKERVERILGKQYSTIFFNECSQISYSSVLTGLTRLAQTSPHIIQRAYYDLNPTTTVHWTYKLFEQKKYPHNNESVPDPENYAFAHMNPEDNKANLSPEFLQSMKNAPTRYRQRFYEGKYVSELPGQLWRIEDIETGRISKDNLPPFKRIVIPVDPSGARSVNDVKADAIGIVPVAEGMNGHFYVLEDLTGIYSPEQWGKIVRDTYDRLAADRVVGERNYGGDMVRAVIQWGKKGYAYKETTSSKGKVLRAEPVAALYERGLVHHVGYLPNLEEEMLSFINGSYLGEGSPNRVDALVFGLTELAGIAKHDLFELGLVTRGDFESDSGEHSKWNDGSSALLSRWSNGPDQGGY